MSFEFVSYTNWVRDVHNNVKLFINVPEIQMSKTSVRSLKLRTVFTSHVYNKR